MAEKLIRYRNKTNVDQILYFRGRRYRLNARTGTIVLPEKEGRKYTQILARVNEVEESTK